MAREQEPMSTEEFEELAADIEGFRAETREALADELGGDSVDYRID